MSPQRVSKGGSYRFDRRFPKVGRISRASGARTLKRFRVLDDLLTELFEDGKLDILRAIRDGRVTIQEVYNARRTGRLSHVVSDFSLDRPLWEAVEAWLPTSAPSEGSRKRYATSFKALRVRGGLGARPTVRGLADVNWKTLKRKWGRSPADWNRLRAAVSRFLTACLHEDKFHPFRREVMKGFPRATEPRGRVPDLTPETFWSLVDAAPPHIRAPLVCLAATGLRVSEYLALEPHHLMPITESIRVPGTKSEASEAILPVGAEAWPWVKEAVPSPVRYRWLRIHFKRAAAAVGQPELRLHDLRHFTGQMLSEGGLPEAKIQQAMRHATPDMTRRYTRQRDRGEAAELIDRTLFRRSKGA